MPSSTTQIEEIARSITSKTDSYYKILGLEHKRTICTQEEIEAAKTKVCALVHPFRNGGNPIAIMAYDIVKAAFQTLGDVEKRKSYDVAYPPQAQDMAIDPTLSTLPQEVQKYERAMANNLVLPFSSTPPKCREHEHDTMWGRDDFRQPEECPEWGRVPGRHYSGRQSLDGWIQLCIQMTAINSLLFCDYLVDHLLHAKILTKEDAMSICAAGFEGWLILCVWMATNAEDTFHQDVLDILFIFRLIEADAGHVAYIG